MASLSAYAAVVSSHPEGVNSKGSSLFIKLKAGLLRQKHLTRSRLTALHSLAGLQACSSLSSLAPRNDAYAFTLAEVLVTLGIIGVVSAMTVPSLMQNYQRQSYVTQLHKVYNETAQALLMFQNDRNAVNLTEAGLRSNVDLAKFVTDYFKVVQTCSSTANCFADEYKSLSGVNFGGMDKTVKSFVLASGASIRPNYALEGDKLFQIQVDINGKKGPNIHGRDLFYLFVYNNGLIDDRGTSAPMTETQRDDSYKTRCQGVSTIGGCFGKILNDNWQMTY